MSRIYALVGTAAVAALAHALLPDHWLPYVLSAKARGMSAKQTVTMTAAGAVTHLVSTVIVGLLFALAGSAVAANVSTGLERIVGFIVIGLGAYYLFKGWSKYRRHHHNHMEKDHHGHCHSHVTVGSTYGLGIILGARPCVEAIPIFLAASTRGVFSSLAAIGTWVLATLLAMVGIVWLSLRGLETARFAWFERNSEIVAGIVIIAVGIIALCE
jgi:ABC-type nickel/cobalt efflux system permease component RcnA